MDDDSSNFIRAVWKYKPIIIILAAVLIVGVGFLVMQTHQHRKKEHKKRHKFKHRDHGD